MQTTYSLASKLSQSLALSIYTHSLGDLTEFHGFEYLLNYNGEQIYVLSSGLHIHLPTPSPLGC